MKIFKNKWFWIILGIVVLLIIGYNQGWFKTEKMECGGLVNGKKKNCGGVIAGIGCSSDEDCSPNGLCINEKCVVTRPPANFRRF